MPVSKQEQRLFDALKPIVKTSIHQSFRPNFLRNVTTGQNLELDIYLPELKIGFEYQGAVHFRSLATYKNDPDKSRLNDTKKQDMLDNSIKRRVAMVEIFETDLDGDIVANVIQRVKNMIVYFYKKRHFAKCQNLQILLNKMDDRFNEEGKRRMRYYELLQNTQRYAREREKVILYNRVENFIKEFPFVADLTYAGENVELPLSIKHKEIRDNPSNRISKNEFLFADKKRLDIPGLSIVVTDGKDILLNVGENEHKLSLEEWRSIKSFIKGRFRFIDEATLPKTA